MGTSTSSITRNEPSDSPRCEQLPIDLVLMRGVHRAVKSPGYARCLEEAVRDELEEFRKVADLSLVSSVKHSWSVPQPIINVECVDDRRRPLSDQQLISPPPRVAVVGATGFYGKFVVEAALSKGYAVSALVRDPEKARRLLTPIADGRQEARNLAVKGIMKLSDSNEGSEMQQKFRTVVGDVRDADAVREAIKDADIVFYCASARNASWVRSVLGDRPKHVDHAGLKAVIPEVERTDAHLVVVSSRHAWRSKLVPIYPWYNFVVMGPRQLHWHRQQERLLLSDSGAIAVKDGQFADRESLMRFSIFRVGTLAYPCGGKVLNACKNNILDDPFHVTHTPLKDICPRVLTTVIFRGLGLARSVIGSRVDVSLSPGLLFESSSTMHDIDAVLSTLRCEP